MTVSMKYATRHICPSKTSTNELLRRSFNELCHLDASVVHMRKPERDATMGKMVSKLFVARHAAYVKLEDHLSKNADRATDDEDVDIYRELDETYRIHDFFLTEVVNRANGLYVS